MDCDSVLLPWEPITGFPMTLNLGETGTAQVPLLTTLESFLGVDVCGELLLTIPTLPSFCTLTVDVIDCTPTLET